MWRIFEDTDNKLSNKKKQKKQQQNKNEFNYQIELLIKNIPYEYHITYLINPNNTNKLYLKWDNYLILSNNCQEELIKYSKSNTFLYLTFTENDLKNHLIQSKFHFRSKFLQDVLNNFPNLIARMIINLSTQLYRLKQEKNIKNLIKNSSSLRSWWINELNSECINYTHWMKICKQHNIIPISLIKQFLKNKRIFCDYQMSLKFNRKPLKDMMKTPKRINKFINEICDIPINYPNWEMNNKLKIKQNKIYKKWINYAIEIHRKKWFLYQIHKWTKSNMKQSMRGNNKLLEFHILKNNNSDPFSIPNIGNILSIKMCNEIVKICISHGRLRETINKFKNDIHITPLIFEKIVRGKISHLLKLFKEVSGNKNLKLFCEKSLMKNNHFKYSPDILFSNPININGIDIIWMDAKYFYLSIKQCDDALIRVKESVLKYTKEFGN